MRAKLAAWAVRPLFLIFLEACGSTNGTIKPDPHSMIFRGEFNHIVKEAAKGIQLAGLNIAAADQTDANTYVLVGTLNNQYMYNGGASTYNQTELGQVSQYAAKVTISRLHSDSVRVHVESPKSSVTVIAGDDKEYPRDILGYIGRHLK